MKPNRDAECPCCGRSRVSSKASLGEIALNAFCVCVILAVLMALGYGLTQWLTNQERHVTDRLLWREPLDEWSL